MLNFVHKNFRKYFNIILWVIVIASAFSSLLAGGNLGGGVSVTPYGGVHREFAFGYAFLGLIVGGVLGLISAVISGGVVVTLLNIDDNIQKLVDKTKNP